MNCEQIEPWISAYQDGELDPLRCRSVREHLSRCSDCRTLSEEWTALAEELRASLIPSAAPEGFHARVMRLLPEPEPAPARGGRAGSWRPWGWLPFGLAPIGAAMAWLLLAPPAPRPAFLSPSSRTAVELASAPAPLKSGPGAASLSPAPSGTAAPRASSGAPDRKKLRQRRPLTREPPPTARPSKAAGAGGLPTGYSRHGRMQSHPRRYRPRRWRYAMAVTPYRWRLPRRPRSGVILASRPQPMPTRPDRRAMALSIRIVDYVLPEVSLPAPQAPTDFVLHPAAPTPASEVGFDL